MRSPLILCESVSFSYPQSSILMNANCEIKQGEFIGIFGPNGGGKTTFLKLLMGFLTPQNGRLTLFEQSPEEARSRIGYVPQVHRTDSDFPITVWELIALGRAPRRTLFSKIQDDDREAAWEWMNQLELLPHKDKAYGELSGGLAQRALLARALISNPDLLLLDEPTANIDPRSLALFLETLEQLKGHKTILLVTHDLNTIVKCSHRLLCIQGDIKSFLPSQLCEHFALGLYHTPFAATPSFAKAGT